jgi:hypothetical protein
MAISQVGSTTNAKTASGNSISCSKPTGVSSGHLLLALVTSNDGAITSSGWTVIGHGSGQPDLFDSTWLYKVAGGSEPSSYSFATGDASSPPMIATITAWSGVDTTNGPIAGTNKSGGNFPGSGSSTEPQTITGATSTPDALPLYSRACRVAADTSPGHPMTFSASGVTELADQGQWSGGTVSYSHAIYMGTQASGNAPNLDVTASGTKNETDNVVACITLYALVTALNANAGAVSATGTAYSATVEIGAPAGAVGVSGSVKDTARSAQAGSPSATVSAKTPAGGVSAAAGSVGASASVKDVGRRASPTAAAATGTVSNGSIPVLADAGAVTAHATTNRPTLTGTNVSAAPELAVAAVQVHQSDTSAVADFGTGTGTAYDATVDIGSAPDAVATTATAYDAVIALEIPSGFSSASATASTPGITDSAAPMADGFLVTETVPQVSTVINGNPAQSVSATGTAFDIDYIRSEVVGAALATVAVHQPTMFFGSTRVIKVASSNRTEVVDSDTRTLTVEAA